MKTASIIAIGNEILNGSTLDSNSHWLCQQIVGRGARVTRICVVPDEQSDIVKELRAQLALEPDLIVTVGGLGPTSDDLTLEAIAAALGLRIVKDKVALKIVQERYQSLEGSGVVGPALSDEAILAREKMACIPEGSTPLFNSVGAAPAVALRSDGTIILSLPGVPSEVKAVMSESAAQVLESSLGRGFYRSWLVMTDTNDESRMARPTADASREYPEIYFKTRPIERRAGKVGITISAGGHTLEQVEVSLNSATNFLTHQLSKHDVRVLEVAKDE